MKTKERIYIIKTGNTLYKVAPELAIPPMELCIYHNIYCEIPDLIETDFPSNLKVLLLPPHKSGIAINSSLEAKPRKISFANGYTLPFWPAWSKKNYD